MPPATRLQTCAAQWMRLAFMLIAFARRFSRLNQAGAHGVEARAEEFEVQLRCAAIMLSRHIAEAEPANVADLHAVQTLCAVRSALLALAMLAAKIRSELVIHSRSQNRWADKGESPQTSMIYTGIHHTRQLAAQEYFDSG